MPIKDPVCGMKIEPQDAAATRPYKGQTFYFCSDNCVRQFDADPARYAAPVSATTGVPTNWAGLARITLPVAGLQRSGGPALERAIGTVPGVGKATVNVKKGRVFVDYDPARATVADLLEAVRSAGFTPDGQTLRLKVSGLYCAECVVKIEDALKATPGVLDATMNAATNEVKVEYAPVIGDLSLLTQAIESAGPYTATRAAEASEPELDKEAQEMEK
ncbi:MAG TPA: cation transporter, partial [Anaerolineae bacterium]|nr:cation transporter [Anaerolineae bacterium]